MRSFRGTVVPSRVKCRGKALSQDKLRVSRNGKEKQTGGKGYVVKGSKKGSGQIL